MAHLVFKLVVLIPFKIELPTNSVDVDVCIDFLDLTVKSRVSITSPVGIVEGGGGGGVDESIGFDCLPLRIVDFVFETCI